MKKLIIILFILISGVSLGQSTSPITYGNKVVGENLINNTEIKGVEYVFPEKIHETFLDTISGYMTVKTFRLDNNGKVKDKGKIFQYDLNHKKLLWHKNIFYTSNQLQQFSNMMIYAFRRKSIFLDVTTGKHIWERNSKIYCIDTTYHIGIGYFIQYSGRYSNVLQGIDLRNGKRIWQRRIVRQTYGWNDRFYINDSTLMVVASGLHTVNIKNGKGWDYNTITGQLDYTKTLAEDLIGVFGGALTGFPLMSTGLSAIRNVASNTLIDSTYIYLASKEQIAKVEMQTGTVVWKQELPKDITSNSTIFMNDGAICMVNNGTAVQEFNQLYFGKPFIATFDKETGQQQYLKEIAEKKDPILKTIPLQDEMLLMFKDRIAKYSIKTGKKIFEKITPKTFGNLNYIIENNIFIEDKNQNFINLNQTDTAKIFVVTTENKILSLDHQLNITDTKIAFKNLLVDYLFKGDYQFLANDKHTLILNHDGKLIAELEPNRKAVLFDKTLYYKKDKSFIAVDLKEILKDE